MTEITAIARNPSISGRYLIDDIIFLIIKYKLHLDLYVKSTVIFCVFLYVESEVHYIAILYDVIFAF